MLCYVVAYLERVNVGFAALTMNQDLGFSATTFAIGAGLFSAGYLLFEIPLSFLFNRFGARWTFSRTMIAWGLVACAMAFIWDERSYFTLRFLLGVTEAGFSLGTIIYLSRWFPSRYRGRILSLFILSLPLSSFIGAPLSGLLVSLPPVSGLRGWQLMFILEALPAFALAAIVLLVLKEQPKHDASLSRDEIDWLERNTMPETGHAGTGRFAFLKTLVDKRVLLFALGYLGILLVHNSLGVWMPQMIRSIGFTTRETGLITALPYFCGMIGMLAWGRHSDRSGERMWHTLLAMITAAAGLAGAAVATSSPIKVACLCIAITGSFSALAVFWTLPTAFLAGPGATAGVALISSIGALSGLVGPVVIGFFKDHLGSYAMGMIAISSLCVIAMGAIFTADRLGKPACQASP
nr:MFS transporter [Burkholderia sp. Ac-20379]